MDVPFLARDLLKKPWGRIIANTLPLRRFERIIAIGDVCTVVLLGAGIIPHLAVFDLKSERAPVSEVMRRTLETKYPHPRVYENPAGTLSDELMEKVPHIVKEGGALKIIGEEDITALAFMPYLDEQTVLVYGQPGKGMVLVKGSKATKTRYNQFISACLKEK